MAYNPFNRGASPVGVCTVELHEKTAARTLTEIWYPARPRYRGQDLDNATRDRFLIVPNWPESRQNAIRNASPAQNGKLPLILFSHGGYGHRREASNICTHLASHGYIVAAPDFPGDNIADSFASVDAESATIKKKPIDESAKARPLQASHFLDQVIDIAPSRGLSIDKTKIGACGGSMGGYTSLAMNSIDLRPSATFAMNPMCGTRSPIPQIHRLQSLLRVDDWNRAVPTCIVTGDADPIIIAEDVRELFRSLRAPKRLAIIGGVGHVHFADHAEIVHEQMRMAYLSGSFPDPEIDAIALGTAMRPFSDLLSEQSALDVACALGLAHMDTNLKGSRDAHAFLENDLVGLFASHGTVVEELKEVAPQMSARLTGGAQ
jgi:predicted dienelactone hydrolase